MSESPWRRAEVELPEESGLYLCRLKNGGVMVLPWSQRHRAFNDYDDLPDTKYAIEPEWWMEIPELPGGARDA